jgi:hypothetical protein
VRGCVLYYTCPADAKEPENPEKIINFKTHLDTAKGHDWIWVLDCRNIATPPMYFLINLARILSTEHKDYLKEIWILFPTRWTQMAVRTINCFFPNNSIFGKSKIFDGDRVEVFEKLEKEGLHDKGYIWITEKIISDPS